MGCSMTRLKNKKLDLSSSIEDMKIQTIFQMSHECKNKISKDKQQKTKKNVKLQKKDTNGQKHAKSKYPKFYYDPKITGKYHIKAVIGKGASSRVLRVEHRGSKQPYALKTIETPSGREAFEAEIGVLRRLNHTNVIKLFEVFESDDKLYMVMELATGGSLLDRLETQGHLSEEDSRSVMKMVISGLKYLHKLGITHRDLKPDNLLYYHPGKDSRIMIADFSFASTRKSNSNLYMHTICGTPQYIAPEIVTRRPYTCAVDMWAIGVITYIVLCGTFPFDAEHDAQIFKLIVKANFQMSGLIWNEVSDESKSFINHLLQTDPSKRLTAECALNHNWMTMPRLTYTPPQQTHNGDRRSQRSGNSTGSYGSGRSGNSLRVSGHRRVKVHHLEALCPDFAADSDCLR